MKDFYLAYSQAPRSVESRGAFLFRLCVRGPLPRRRCHRPLQEYQCSDGTTFRGRLPLGIFPDHQPGELLNVHRVFPSRSLRLACPEYLLSDGGTSSGRLPPDLSLSRQLGEVPYLQGMDRCGYSPPPERILSGETTFGEQSPSNPVPNHQARDARTGIPSSSLRLRRSAAIPQEAFLEYQLSDGSTFSGRLPPGLFPNLQPGEVVDIQSRFRRGSSSLPSRAVPENDLSDGRVFGGHPPTH